MATVTQNNAETAIRETATVRVYSETQLEMLREQAERAQTGDKPTYADLIEEAWAAYKKQRKAS